MTTTLFLHRLTSLRLKPIEARQHEHSTRIYYTRDLIGVGEDGAEFTLHLFSETRKGLQLGGDEAVHLEPALELAAF